MDVTAYELKKVADQEETFQVEYPIRNGSPKKSGNFCRVSECVKDTPCFLLTQRTSLVGGLWLWFTVFFQESGIGIPLKVGAIFLFGKMFATKHVPGKTNRDFNISHSIKIYLFSFFLQERDMFMFLGHDSLRGCLLSQWPTSLNSCK